MIWIKNIKVPINSIKCIKIENDEWLHVKGWE